jgi:hypothetical protein
MMYTGGIFTDLLDITPGDTSMAALKEVEKVFAGGSIRVVR